MNPAGSFWSPTHLINKFDLKRTFLQAFVINYVCNSGFMEIRKFGKRLPVVKSQNIDTSFRTKRVTSFTYMYDTLRKSVAAQPTKVQSEWSGINYYSIPFLCTSASKLRSFQSRIHLHRIIGTNVLLMKMGIKHCDNQCLFAIVNLKP